MVNNNNEKERVVPEGGEKEGRKEGNEEGSKVANPGKCVFLVIFCIEIV